MNRPPDRASIKIPSGHAGRSEVSLSLRFALTLMIIVLCGVAASVAVTQPSPVASPLSVQALHDPDRVLSSATLRPSSSAWKAVKNSPLEHLGGVTWLLIKTDSNTRIEASTIGIKDVEVFVWTTASSPPRYKLIDRVSHSITHLDVDTDSPILLRLNEQSTSTIALRTLDAKTTDQNSTIRVIQLLVIIAGLVLISLNGVETLMKRLTWNSAVAAFAISMSQITILLTTRAGFTVNDEAGLHYQGIMLAGWLTLAIAFLIRDAERPALKITRYGILCFYTIVYAVMPSDILSVIFPPLVLFLVLYYVVVDPLPSMVADSLFYALLAVNSTWLYPSWPEEYLAFYGSAVGIFVLFALARVTQLLRTFAQQQYAFEKLQYELRHEHSARLYITSSTAHELNNPINFISSGVGLQLEQFGELRDLVDVVFHEVDDPDALDLKQRFDSTLRSILNITLDIQAGALRSAASLDHLRGLSPSNAEIMSTFWTVEDILNHAIDRVELQYMQHARTHLMIDLSPEDLRRQLSTNLYFLSDAVGKIIVMALIRSPDDRNVVRVHLEVGDALARLKISYPGSLPKSESHQHNMDRLDHLEHIYECLQLVGCTICCTHDVTTHSSTFTILIPTQGVLK